MLTAKEKLFDNTFDFWLKKFNLTEWDIQLDFLDKEEFKALFLKNNKLVELAPACCESLWQYQQAKINVNSDKLETVDDSDMEKIVIHEFMHIFLSEMRNNHKDGEHEERVATMLARAFIGINNFKEAHI